MLVDPSNPISIVGGITIDGIGDHDLVCLRVITLQNNRMRVSAGKISTLSGIDISNIALMNGSPNNDRISIIKVITEVIQRGSRHVVRTQVAPPTCEKIIGSPIESRSADFVAVVIAVGVAPEAPDKVPRATGNPSIGHLARTNTKTVIVKDVGQGRRFTAVGKANGVLIVNWDSQIYCLGRIARLGKVESLRVGAISGVNLDIGSIIKRPPRSRPKRVSR